MLKYLTLILTTFISAIQAIEVDKEVTVVSALFHLPNPTKRPGFYIEKTKIFMEKVENPVVYFSTPNIIKQLSEYVESIGKKDRVTFVPMEVEDMVAIQRYGYEFWEEWPVWSRARVSTPEMSMIWYEKKEFVLKAIELNPYNSETFIWVDTGCIRDPDWFDVEKFAESNPFTFEMKSDKVYIATFTEDMIIKVYSQKNPKLLVDNTRLIAAAILIGSDKAWVKYSEAYDEMMKEYMDAGESPAEDQDIIGALTLYRPDLAEGVSHNNKNPNTWFHLIWTLQGRYLRLKGLPLHTDQEFQKKLLMKNSQSNEAVLVDKEL